MLSLRGPREREKCAWEWDRPLPCSSSTCHTCHSATCSMSPAIIGTWDSGLPHPSPHVLWGIFVPTPWHPCLGPQATSSKRCHETSELGLEVVTKYYLSSHSTLGANPMWFPWTLAYWTKKKALNILQILLMSCLTAYIILSWPLGSLGLMRTSIGNEHIILFHTVACTR